MPEALSPHLPLYSPIRWYKAASPITAAALMKAGTWLMDKWQIVHFCMTI
jgi:hypothetical protein